MHRVNRNNRLSQSTRDLWWRCGSVLAAILLVAIVKWMTLDFAIKNSQADGDLINLAGRQRMHTLNLSRTLFGFRLAEPNDILDDRRYWNGILESSYYDFCSGHEAIRDRRDSAGLLGSHSANVQAKLTELEPIYQQIKQMGIEVAAEANAKRTTAVSIITPEQVGLVIAQTDEYLKHIDVIAYQLANESRERIIEARRLSRWGIVATLLLVLIMASFVLAPAIRRLSGSLKSTNTIIETAGDGILVSDVHGRIQRANSKAGEILSRNIDQLQESSIFDCFEISSSVFSLENQPPEGTAASDLLLSGHRAVGFGPNKNPLPIELSMSQASIQGETYFVTIFRDVRERLMLEEELSHSRKMTALGELSAGISHEINTPMQYISDNVNYVKESLDQLFDVVTRYEKLLMEDSPMDWEQRRQEIHSTVDECNLARLQADISDAVADCQEGVDKTAAIVRTMSQFSKLTDDDYEPIDLKSALEANVSSSKIHRQSDIRMEIEPQASDLEQ